MLDSTVDFTRPRVDDFSEHFPGVTTTALGVRTSRDSRKREIVSGEGENERMSAVLLHERIFVPAITVRLLLNAIYENRKFCEQFSWKCLGKCLCATQAMIMGPS